MAGADIENSYWGLSTGKFVLENFIHVFVKIVENYNSLLFSIHLCD